MLRLSWLIVVICSGESSYAYGSRQSKTFSVLFLHAVIFFLSLLTIVVVVVDVVTTTAATTTTVLVLLLSNVY